MSLAALTGWWFYLEPKLADRFGGVPPGAVVAFDRSDFGADQCPTGWSPFLEARGRTIVGAGNPAKAPGKLAYDIRGRKLQEIVLRQHGGNQAIVPNTDREFVGSDSQSDMNLISNKGIVPWISLHYCKKDARL